MLDDDNATPTESTENSEASRPVESPAATDPADAPTTTADSAEPAVKKPAKKAAAKKTAAKKAPAKKTAAKKTATKAAAKKTTTKKATAKKAAEPPADEALPLEDAPEETPAEAPVEKPADTPADAPGPVLEDEDEAAGSQAPPTMLLFKAPEVPAEPARRSRRKAAPAPEPEPSAETQAKDDTGDQDDDAAESADADRKQPKGKGSRGRSGGRGNQKPADAAEDTDETTPSSDTSSESASDDSDDDADGDNEQGGPRRRRRRGGRRRRKGDGNGSDDNDSSDDGSDSADGSGPEEKNDKDSGNEGGGTRRRRRRRRAGEEGGGDTADDPENTVTRVRKTRSAEDQITAVAGSTRLEAKKQRRREGREAGRRRAPIVSEAEFLSRRESVDRTMVIRQHTDLTQIAVLEDKVLVEHYVARESQTSLIGNVYVGRVQNVLPSMEAAFVDIGKGRNAVIYAGEVNWSALGHKDGQPRKIESVLSSGQSILVQVTKDPIGHKGARLTSQISLAGRFLVYVPDGTTSGISRKLPDTERSRLKALLKEIVPDTAGVIVRTAAEGAAEEELTQDVERLKARWESIEAKSKSGGSPKLLYGEPDLTLKVVRDLFTEDFSKLVIEGDEAWKTVQDYVHEVAPDLEERLERFEPGETGGDSFSTHRVDEQIAKGLDRKVWLPSGGSLIIDRTEAMTVVDVNTGKFTGSGGNLEETVTKNNLEAAEEIVRQLRLRDIGGIIVVDFIDMVLENNRDLVLRRLVECLGRDRTRHQVAEVTSLGLVQMTRKRIGTGLLESFSEDCSHCQGRGVVIHDVPVEPKKVEDDRRGGGRRRGRKGENGSDGNRGGGGQRDNGNQDDNGKHPTPSPKDVAAVAKPENADRAPLDETETDAAEVAEDASSAKGDQDSREGKGSGRSGGRSGRPRRGSGGEHAESTEPVRPPVAPVEPRPVTEPTGAAESLPVEETPKVVTRTRTRRAATRTTGVSTSTPVTPIQVEPTQPAQPAETVSTPAPKVVTSTRTRRGASRPAGTGPAPAEAAETAPEEPAEQPAELHVPIKKKGGRKH